MEKPGARLRKEKILETCLLCLYLHNPIFRLIQSLALNFTGVIYIYIYLFVFWRNKIFKNWKRYICIIGEIDNWHEFNKEKLKKLLKMRRVEWNFRNDWTKPTKLTKRERERRKKDENPGNDHRTGVAERNKEDQRRRQGVIATFRWPSRFFHDLLLRSQLPARIKFRWVTRSTTMPFNIL